MDAMLERIEAVVRRVLEEQGRPAPAPVAGDVAVPVGVSNRHVHLSQADVDRLFGPGHALARKKAMKQPGQYAAEETVTLRGPKGSIGRVRVLGPTRRETQVEISIADGFVLGLRPPVRLSGDLEGTPGVEIVGPSGSVHAEHGVIAARRHVHLVPATARRLGLANGDDVAIAIPGDRGGTLARVAVRVAADAADELHIDLEEANACLLKNDDLVVIRPTGPAAKD